MGNEQMRSAIEKLRKTQIILSQIETMQSVEPRHELDRLIGPQ
jgi:hypothetical protein